MNADEVLIGQIVTFADTIRNRGLRGVQAIVTAQASTNRNMFQLRDFRPDTPFKNPFWMHSTHFEPYKEIKLMGNRAFAIEVTHEILKHISNNDFLQIAIADIVKRKLDGIR